MPSQKKSRSREDGRRLTPGGMKALMAAGTIAAGTQAYADPIRFDNPGNQWDWNLSGSIYSSNPDQYLDITLDSASQGDTYLSYTNFRQGTYPGYSSASAIYTYAGLLSTGYYSTYALAVASGSLIGGGAQQFSNLPWISVSYYGSTVSFIPEGVQTYLGARIKLAGQYHYGWIGVVRTGTELDAFAWGYETDPGVPVAAGIPEPGSLALLALGFAAVRRRA